MDDRQSVQYRDVPGFPGYRVGDDGSVWSRWVKTRKPNGCGFGGVIGDQWRPLKLCWVRGDTKVSLCRDGKSYPSAVHRVVLLAFVGPCPPGMVCRHFPDPSHRNNRLDNLSWGTHKENADDRVAHGTDPRGERGPNAKLTEAQVVEIRGKYAAAKGAKDRAPRGTLNKLAAEYQVSRANIILIVYRFNWTHC